MDGTQMCEWFLDVNKTNTIHRLYIQRGVVLRGVRGFSLLPRGFFVLTFRQDVQI